MSESQRRWVRVTVAMSLAGLVLWPVLARAQTDQFGERSRAVAANQLIVLAVQQGISSLPPTSGQSFTYDFKPDLGTWSASEWLGPTSFRSPEPIGKDRFSVRFATSYFDLSQSFGPALYAVNDTTGKTIGYTDFGLKASAQVESLNFGVTYGATDRLDLMLNVPVVITDVSASQSFLVNYPDANTPLDQVNVAGVSTSYASQFSSPQGAIDSLLHCNDPDCLRHRSASMGQLSSALASNGFPGLNFNEGTNVGVGRISIGAKYMLYPGERYKLAAMAEFFEPSPNQAQFAGSDTASFLPRLVGAASVTDAFKLHTDVGYEADFSQNELRRFTWNTGASYAFPRVTLDAGFGGSKFNEGITWTPNSAPYGDLHGQPLGTIVAQGNNTLGSNFVDFLGGVKFKVADHWVVSGAVNVPINNEGFRAAAVGTGALEYYF